MTTRIPISYGPIGDKKYHQFFKNWQDEIIFNNDNTLGYTNYIQKVNSELAKVGAVMVRGGKKDRYAYLHFERKEDAVLFLLRWC